MNRNEASQSESTEQKARESESQFLNAFADPELATEAILKIEGRFSSRLASDFKEQEWIANQFNSALAIAKESVEELKRSGKPIPGVSSGFQGTSGWNRYEINSDGTVTISRYHSVTRCIEEARRLGIRVSEL